MPDERALLEQFEVLFNQLDPDIIIGWSVISFDFRLLISRAERHNMTLIGQDGSHLAGEMLNQVASRGF